MRTRVWVRGLRAPGDVVSTVTAGADALGFALDETTSLDQVRCAAAVVPPGATSILETDLNAPDAIADAASRAQISTILLRRPCSADVFDRLDTRAPSLQRILNVAADDGAAAQIVQNLRTQAQAILLEAGATPDWDLCAELVREAQHPVYLDGELTPKTVARAIQIVRPFGLVLSPGREGVGSEDLHPFFHAVRAADWALAARAADDAIRAQQENARRR